MKSWKKRLAVILSAAMVMTAGTGMPGYGRSSAVSLKTALASVRTEDSGGAVSGVKATSSDAEMLRATSSSISSGKSGYPQHRTGGKDWKPGDAGSQWS